MKNSIKTRLLCLMALWAAGCTQDNISPLSDEVIQTLFVRDVFADEAVAQAQLLQKNGVKEMGFTLESVEHDGNGKIVKRHDTGRSFLATHLDMDEKGIFRQYIDGLLPDSVYTVTAYVITGNGSRFQGLPVTFRTNKSKGSIGYVTLANEAELSALTGRTFTVTGLVMGLGGDSEGVLEYGVVYWPLSNVAETAKVKVVPDGFLGVNFPFSVVVADLLPDTDYQCQMYAANSRRPQYFPVLDFRTKPVTLPESEMISVTDVEITSATLSVRLLNNGNDPYTAVGVYFKGGSYPEEKYAFRTEPVEELDGSGEVVSWLYTDKIYTLQGTTVYTFQAYGVNYKGEKRSSNTITATQTLPPSIPKITTFPIVENEGIGAIRATLKGMITSTGGKDITEYGIAYGMNDNALNNKVKAQNNATVDAPFSIEIGDLTPATQYYFRMYAVNSLGEGVSDTYAFKTGIDGGMLQVGKQVTGGIGSIVASNIPLSYFELEPVNVTINDPITGSSQSAKIYFLDRNLGARLPFPKATWTENQTFNPIDGSPMSIADWVAWYGGYYFKWDRREAKMTCWLIPNGQDASALRPMLASSEYTGNEATQRANCGWANDNNASSAAYINGIRNWSAANDPCPAGYHIPTSFEWQAVSLALKGERGEDNPVDFNFLNQRLRLGAAGQRQPNGQAPSGSEEEHTANVAQAQYVGYLWSSTAVAQPTPRTVYSSNRFNVNLGVLPASWTFSSDHSDYNQFGLVYSPTYYPGGSRWADVGNESPVDYRTNNAQYTNYYYFDEWHRYGIFNLEAFRGVPVRCIRTVIN